MPPNGVARLRPSVRRLVDMLSLAQAGTTGLPSLDDRRQAFRDLMRLAYSGPEEAAVDVHEVESSLEAPRLRVYSPPERKATRLPGLVFLHGGGLICGDLDTHDALCRTLCGASGARVIAVDYRLAPEHQFPAAVGDAVAGTTWVLDRPDALGVDPARIGIAGESAGGTLAAVACQAISRARPGVLRAQLLLCPITEWAAESPSRQLYGHGYLLNRTLMAQELAWYLPAGVEADDGLVSPLRASELGGQPQTHIHTAEFDPLRDEGHAYADRLRASGVAVYETCHLGMIHLFYGLGRIIPEGRAALRQIGIEIGTALTNDDG